MVGSTNNKMTPFTFQVLNVKLQFKAHPGKSLSFVPLQDALLFIVLKAGVHESIYFHEA